jgi:hypothetical protein
MRESLRQEERDRELRRRIRNLETAPSVPGLSVISVEGGGLNSDEVTSSSLIQITSANYADPGFEFPDAVEVVVSDSGRLLVYFGGNCQLFCGATGSPPSASVLQTLQVEDLDNGPGGLNERLAPATPYNIFSAQANSRSFDGCLARTTIIGGLVAGRVKITCKYSYSGTSGSGGWIYQPYIIAIPI